MKDKTLPYFLTILPTTIFILTFFSYFKKSHSSPLQNKQTFVVQTMAFQVKLLCHYGFLTSYSTVVKLSKMLINPALPNHK